MERKLQITLGIILTFVAIGAIPAGYSMLVRPDGSDLGFTQDFLAGSPFKNYFIPGIFLISFNGILGLIASILCFAKHKYTGQLGLYFGIFLVLWIIVQVYSTGLISFMQPMFFVVGLIEMTLGLILIKRKKLVMVS